MSRGFYTYGISAVSGVLGLCLVELHLLLVDLCFNFCVFGADDFQ